MYFPDLERSRAAREKTLQDARADVKQDSMDRLMKDLTIDRANNPDAALLDKWEQEEDEDEVGADEGLDVNIRDQSTFLSLVTLSGAD